ncbi:MAG: sodium:solute symporter family protein [Tuberibacillus sp.]
MNTTNVWIGMVIYIVMGLTVAVLSRAEKQTDMAGYFIGGRKIGGLVSALSYSSTTYSAFMMVGLAGLTYKGGVGALGFEIIYFTGVSLVAIFGPRFWLAGKKFGYVTPAEMVGDRYNSKATAVAIALVNCLFLIPYSAVQLMGVGYLLEGLTNHQITFMTGVVIATILTIVFTLFSGIRSVVWTDSLQALIMIVSSTIVVIVIIAKIGGFGEFFGSLQSHHPEAFVVPGNGTFNFLAFLGLAIPWFFFSLSNPQVSQRLFMPKSFKGLKQMLIGFLVFGFIYTMVSVLWGFSALQMFPNLSNPDLATPTLLSSGLVPPVLGIVVMIGIFAAAISTLESILLTLSSLFSRDVYGKFQADERKQLKVGKVVIPIIAVLAFLFAQLNLNLIAVLSVASSAGLIVVVPAIIGTFFWKRGTAAGALTSVVVPAAIVLILQYNGWSPLGLGAGIWGLILSAVLFIGVSLVTKAPTEKAQAFINDLKNVTLTTKETEAKKIS